MELSLSKVQTADNLMDVLLVSALCWFSEATLSEVSATSGSTDSLLLHAWLSLSLVTRALSSVVECWPGFALFNQTVDITFLCVPVCGRHQQLPRGYDAWNVQVLSGNMVQVQCL